MATINETGSPVKRHSQPHQRLNEGRSTIRRAKKDREHPYLQVRRSTAQDERLSFEARGLLLYLLSKPETWTVQNSDLQKQGKIGMHVLKRVLKELETFGYMSRNRVRLPDGTFIWERVYYEAPEENLEAAQPQVENQPVVDEPLVDEPLVENQPSYIKEIVEKSDLTKHTHTRRARAPERPPAAGVGVSSNYSYEQRKRYAANNRDKSGALLGPGWLQKSRDGSSDELIAEWYATQARESSGAAPAQRDTSACPDCSGSNFFYPQGRAAGAAKCKHPRLGRELPPLPPEAESHTRGLTAGATR